MSNKIIKLKNNIHPPFTFLNSLLEQDIQKVESVNNGIMNYVFRITCKNGQVFYAKQALNTIKSKKKVGQDLKSISPSRIASEYKAVSVLQELLPSRSACNLSKITLYDSQNNILICKEIKYKNILQADLEQGVFGDNKLTNNIGKALSDLHAKTANKEITIRENWEEDFKVWILFLRMRTVSFINNIKLPEDIVEIINKFYNQVVNKYSSPILMHLDFCPKNILYDNKKRVYIVDFEFATGYGDPAYDLGFMLGHYWIFGNVFDQNNYIDAGKNILFGYLKKRDRSYIDTTFTHRVLLFSALTMLYRIGGSSRASYIPRDKEADLLNYAYKILRDNYFLVFR